MARSRLLSFPLLTSFVLMPASPAIAASLQKVDQSEWSVSGLPSYVNMYLYVPDKLAAKPPILVASHHCQGTGNGTFNETKSNLVALADKNGFIMVFPEATGHNCWDVGSAKSLKHDGGGDTHAIAQMVKYTLSKYNADASRVYAFGGSSGAMMTQALMGIYPDVFMAGVAISGVPCGCWAEQYTGDTATNGQWSGPCAGGSVTKTAAQWGDLVRSMFSGYTGHRPRLQLWHGDPDTTISYNNMGEAIKEWTNVLGLSTTPTTTDSPKSDTTHQIWKNDCGYTVLETFSVKGAGHAVNWDVNVVAGFLGLDKAVEVDPEAAACSGSGGNTGSGGTSSGTGARGGAGPVGGGGASSATPGGPGGSSAAAKGGSSGSGLTSSRGGSSNRSGASSAAPGSGGDAEGGEDDATGGLETGGTRSSGTRRSSASSAKGGGDASSTAAVTKGGSTGALGSGQSTPAATSNGTPSDGCNCIATRRSERVNGASQVLLLAALGLCLTRRRARR